MRGLAEREPWPDQKRVENRLLVGRLQRIFIKPWVFTIADVRGQTVAAAELVAADAGGDGEHPRLEW